ncbi:DoxX family membrane protein [Niabella ginsengisoli]|uniref:DoxX family membrane protein n=1 Tax=Niabella ginsengisoli TaxID=522298 RepID=A0ABS9SPF3_9BACT|nr:MauE/DoxX family redox-associated membrane protein [Niabella ginsengisoli]MCH5600034.1 DoxX family membrane protein [Niabella ginsengisoli]
MKIVKTILCVVFGLMFINAGLDKFLNYMPKPPLEGDQLKLAEAMMLIKWLMPLVGFIEILGGLLFLFPKTRALGAIVILPVMVGIIIHNAIYMPSGLAIAGVMLLINIWIIIDSKEKYKPMVS